MPKSEALYFRTVCKDGGICVSTCCIESGDDLDPFFIGLGHGDWVGVDGSLTGAFFSLRPLPSQRREEEKFDLTHVILTTLFILGR